MRVTAIQSMAVASAAACCLGQSALADQTYATVVWNCVSGGAEHSFARFDVTRSTSFGSGDSVMAAANATKPFRCAMPWGELDIEVLGYNSPGDVHQCGLAESWGLKVTAKGVTVFDQVAENARGCFADTFNPFMGWVQSDDERIEICQASIPNDRTYSCTTVWPDDL